MERIIKKWKFKPVHGGGICLHGFLTNGEEWLTTPIVGVASKNVVVTKSGTRYIIEADDKAPGMWGLGLFLKRRQEYTMLANAGILPDMEKEV